MNNEINDKTYIPLTPFKGWVLENFPFIEADFDAITNYELLCLIVKYLNEVISNQNQVQELGTELVTAYNELLEYVNNYFDNLDVQEEINNKLDLMAQDGTLTNLIKNYVDPIYTAYTNNINSEIASMNTKIDAVRSGSPLVASSTANMTDTTRIYVNTTDGKWYYYNGTSWVAGGTYQATGVGSSSVGYNELKPQLQEYFENDLQLELGTVNIDTGTKISSTTRCIINNYYRLQGNSKIQLTNKNYRYAVSYYDNEHNYLNSSEWYATPITQGTNSRYVYFWFKRVDNSAITNEDMKNISNSFTVNQQKVINIESDTKHQYNKIPLNNLDLNSQKGIQKGILLSGESYNNTPIFVAGSLSNGTLNTNISRDNKSMINFLENEKITFTLKQGSQCKLARYNSDGTWQNDTSWTSATDNDISVSYNVTSKGKLSFATNLDNTNGTTNLEDMAVNFIHSPLVNSNKVTNNNFIHFSFDDVTRCFTNLNTNKNTFTSIFQDNFLNYLKSLHESYGAKFSLYCNNISLLNSIGDHYKNDFIANNDWLKIGNHSANGELMSTLTTEQAKTNYDNFVNYILTMAGLNSIDRIPRLEGFNGTQDQINALRDTKCGIYGLLTADDDREQGYLTNNQESYLYENNNLFDTNHGMIYYSTNLRLDTFVSGYSSTHTYHTNTADNPYDELVLRYSDPNYSNYNQDLIVFTHEWQVYSQNYNLISTMQNYIEQVLQFANQYGYIFDYVQNRVPNIKSLTI